MRARDLPCVRTARFAIARSTTWREVEAGLIGDTPACRSASFGHRLILDEPPWPHFEQHLATWRSAHAGKGVPTAYLCFEAEGVQSCPEAPPGLVAYTLSAMGLDAAALQQFTARPLPEAITIRPAQAADWPALHALGLLINSWQDDDSGQAYLRWALAERRAQVEDGHGAQWAAFAPDGSAIAAAAVIDGPHDSRYQDVQTHPEWRGRGLASSLVAGLAKRHLDRRPDRPLWITAERDSEPERIYARIGFRTRFTSWEFGHPAPRSDAEIAQLLADFEASTLPTEQWHHREHLLVAAALLRVEPDLPHALDRLRDGLHRFLDAHGIETGPTSGYHETITRGWLELMQRELDPDLPLEDAALRACLRLGDKLQLLSHWSRDVLLSPESRAAWIEPDLRPIQTPTRPPRVGDCPPAFEVGG